MEPKAIDYKSWTLRNGPNYFKEKQRDKYIYLTKLDHDRLVKTWSFYKNNKQLERNEIYETINRKGTGSRIIIMVNSYIEEVYNWLND